MGISKVIIRNFKSLENIVFDLEKSTYNIQCFLGENGSGKSNFIDALSYFYLNLQSDEMGSQVVFDKRNPYSQKVIIEITYDFSGFNYNGNSYIEDRIGVYLPKGAVWMNVWTKKTWEGGQSIEVETPLDQMPLFVRDGFVLDVCEP